MRLLGAALVAVSISLIGLRYSRALTKRVRLLQSAVRFISAVAEQMRISRDELPLILSRVQEKIGIRDGVLYGTEGLCRQEIAVLESFCRQLGRTDLNGQQNAARIHIQELEQILQKAREDEARYSRLYASLGVLCGLFVAIMIL